MKRIEASIGPAVLAALEDDGAEGGALDTDRLAAQRYLYSLIASDPDLARRHARAARARLKRRGLLRPTKAL